jgi:hypothetical protein
LEADSIPLNLLLFPLVGGYYMTTRIRHSKYIGQRLSSQAIIFNAVLNAVPLMIVSLASSTALTYYLNNIVEWIKKDLFPIKDEFFGTCLLSLIIAFLYTKIVNFRIDETEAIYDAIQEIGNELELLFADSCVYSFTIQVTLKNDKVYVGWVKVLPKPDQCPYIQLVPLLSGYRNNSKEMIITTDYSPVYNDLIKKGKVKSVDEADMNLVLQVNEIISASRFDFDTFEAFTKNKAAHQ